MIVKLLSILLILHVSYANGDCPSIINKASWGGRAAKHINYLVLPLPHAIIHHTVTPECTTRYECSLRISSIQNYHMDTLGWNDIGYNFIIGGDGNIYEGAGWNKEGAHTLGYNKNSIGIAFIGNFEDKNASNKMLDAAHKLIRCGVSGGVLRDNVRVLNARQVSSTLSPGRQLAKQIESWPEWTHSEEN